MPDSKITALASIGTGTDPVNDALVIVDVSDVSPGGMSATGTTKRVSLNNLLASSPTATLASATITGDLTVDTNSLYVNSSTNNVGLGTLTPSGASGRALEIYGGAGQSRLALKNDTTGSASTDGSQIALVGSQLVIQNREASEITFETNNSERYRLASDGIATWSNVGGVAGTAMTLNATGLGVGAAPTTKLDVLGSGDGELRLRAASDAALILSETTANKNWKIKPSGGDLYFQYSATAYNSGYSSLMSLTATGNVGIGVAPSAWKTNHKAVQFGPFSTGYGSIYTDDAGNSWFNSLNFQSATTRQYVSTGNAAAYRLTASGQHQWYTDSVGGVAGGTVSFTQAMTLTAGGDLLVGTTTSASSRIISSFLSSSGNLGIKLIDSQSNNTAIFANFSNGTGTLGTITNNNNGGVLYNTISDYRLKESVTPLSGGLARVNALKPSIYKWKSSGLSGEGFLAHELAEVVPFAVSGEKDAVSEDGAIQYQGIDMSRVVPILVAAIQELAAEVNALKNA